MRVRGLYEPCQVRPSFALGAAASKVDANSSTVQMQRPQAAARKRSPIHPLRYTHWALYRLPNPDCWNSRNPSFANTTTCNYNHSCRCCYTRIILTADMKDVPLGCSAEEEPPYHRAYASCGTRHALIPRILTLTQPLFASLCSNHAHDVASIG